MEETGELAARIEETYRAIARTRMAGLPILNPRLEVALGSLRRLEEGHVAILVTPWFMNLLFLAGEGELGGKEAGLKVGQSRMFVLPSGPYEALACYEEGLGWHWSCSLFSPMFEFADMESALQTAQLSLELLLTAPDAAEERDRGAHDRGEAESEDFREAMIWPKGAGSAQQRLAAMAREEDESAAREAAVREVARSSSSGLDRRALFGLRHRNEGGK